LEISGFIFRRENLDGFPEYRHKETGIEFVLLPGGEFDMGRPDISTGRKWSGGPFEALHKVTLSPFLIAKYQVTQAVWERVMGRETSRFKWKDFIKRFEGRNLPVVNVSWEECQEFLRKTGLALPTEAQWEYACRGERFIGWEDTEDMAWVESNSGGNGGKAHPVGEKERNSFGLYDMLGNVDEWCQDYFKKDFYEESAGGKDPMCEDSGSGRRIMRGGGLLYVPLYVPSHLAE